MQPGAHENQGETEVSFAHLVQSSTLLFSAAVAFRSHFFSCLFQFKLQL